MTEKNPDDFLPSVEELEDAANVCFDYAKYLKLTEPTATRSISWLESAADELYSAADYYSDDESDEDEDENEDENGDTED